MRLRVCLRGMVAAIWIAVAGCGGGDESDQQDAGADAMVEAGSDATAEALPDAQDEAQLDANLGPPEDVAAFAQRLASVVCSKLEACASILPIVLDPWSCEDAFVQLFFRPDVLQEQVDAGELTYSASDAASCLDSLASLSCEDIGLENLGAVIDASCRAALHGGQDTGEACVEDIQCQPGLYCFRGSSCPGTCQPYVSEGGDCSGGEQCAPALVCANGMCVMPVGEGDSCTPSGIPACGPGLACDSDTNTCQRIFPTPSADLGDSCNPMVGSASAVFCASGLSCAFAGEDSSGMPTFQCIEANLAEGAPCPFGLPDPCGPGLYCAGLDLTSTPPVVMGTCQPIPGAGEPCAAAASPLFDEGLCAPGTWCDATAVTPICVRPKTDGTCRTDDVCRSGNCVRSGPDPVGMCLDIFECPPATGP